MISCLVTYLPNCYSTLQLNFRSGRGKGGDGGDVLRERRDTGASHSMAQKLHRVSAEKRLVWVDDQAELPEAGEHCPHVGQMLLEGGRGYEDVVQVDEGKG